MKFRFDYRHALLLIALFMIPVVSHGQMFWGIEEYPIPWPPEPETSSSTLTQSTDRDLGSSSTLRSVEEKDVETPFLMMGRETQIVTILPVSSLHAPTGTTRHVPK